MPERTWRAGLGAALRTLFDALGPRRRRQLWRLTALTIAGGLADLAFVAAALLFLAALGGDGDPGLPLMLADWFDALAGSERAAAAAALFAGAALLANGLRLVSLKANERYLAAVTHELNVEVQRRVFAQPFEYHVLQHSSELLSTLDKVRAVVMNLVHQWLQTVAALATGLALAWLVISIDPVPALVAFAGLGIFYLAVAAIASRRLNVNSAIVGRAYGERIRQVQESLGAIRDIKLDHGEAARLDDFARADGRYATAIASTAVIAGAPRFIVEAGAVLLIAGLAAVLAARGADGALLLVAGIAVGGLRLLPLVQQAYRSWAATTANRAIIGQVADLLRLPVAPEPEEPVAALSFQSSIQLDGVGFRYPGRAEPALEGVSLAIASGERLGLAGPTGSGKSTLVDILIGLLAPQFGALKIDGRTLDAAAIRAWQRNIAHVSQSIFLADASIARNIAASAPDGEIEMDRVRACAAQAGLAGFIDSLPEGLETLVGERGVRLSGGQRQRIGIARALYKQAPVLILDEATNALDEAMEGQVLDTLFADDTRTIVVIAHRPSALRHCDRVVRLENGRLAG